MNETPGESINGSMAEKLVYFPRADGSRIPFKVYSSPEIYQLEQERIFRGPTWSFVGLEAEIPRSQLSTVTEQDGGTTRKREHRATRRSVAQYCAQHICSGTIRQKSSRTRLPCAFPVAGTKLPFVLK
jgi:hypothetical protein